MRILPKVALAAALLGSTGARSAFAALGDTGCPPGMHRAESEAAASVRGTCDPQGGVRSPVVSVRVNRTTRKAEVEGGGVGSVNPGPARPRPKAAASVR